jgi:hypothetical protein
LSCIRARLFNYISIDDFKKKKLKLKLKLKLKNYVKVGYSAGDDCANLMRKATADAEARYPAVKSLYGAEDLDQADFFYMVADGNAMAVQYGKRTDICSALSAAASAGDPLPEAQAKFLLDLWGANFGTSCFYSTQCLQFNNTQDRSWRWQTCRQLAYFQGAPTPSEGLSIRSKVVTVQYQVDQCKQVPHGMCPCDLISIYL